MEYLTFHVDFTSCSLKTKININASASRGWCPPGSDTGAPEMDPAGELPSSKPPDEPHPRILNQPMPFYCSAMALISHILFCFVIYFLHLFIFR